MKKNFSTFLFAIVATTMPAVVSAAEPITVKIDTGTDVTLQDTDANEYYEIATSDELYAFAAAVNGGNNTINGELTANIIVNTGDVAGCEGIKAEGWRMWTPIGGASVTFEGGFNGNNYIISGLYFNDDKAGYVGVFGRTMRSTIQELGVENTYFHGDYSLGGIIGQNGYASYLTNCYSHATVVGDHDHVGGVVGYNFKATMSNCYHVGNVSGGTNYIGAVAGESYEATTSNCYYLAGATVGGVNGADVVGEAEAKTAAQFASGEVAYLLNEATSEGTLAWGQNIDNEATPDAYPVLGGATVYCKVISETEKEYTNTYVATLLDNLNTTNTNLQKLLRKGQLIILRDGVEYNAMGQEL